MHTMVEHVISVQAITAECCRVDTTMRSSVVDRAQRLGHIYENIPVGEHEDMQQQKVKARICLGL